MTCRPFLRRLALLVLCLAVAPLALSACSDDDGDGGDTDTTNEAPTDTGGDDTEPAAEGTPPSIPVTGEVDLVALNEEVSTYLEATFPDFASGSWEITAVDTETGEVTVSPTDGNDPTAEDAMGACETYTALIYGSLPTAMVQFEDAAGDVVVDNSGGGGSCTEVE